MRSGFANDACDFPHVHTLSVFKPKNIELERREPGASRRPKTPAVFLFGNQHRGIIEIGNLRKFILGCRPSRAMKVDTFAAGDGEEPTDKGITRVELIERIESPDERVLSQLASIGLITTGLENEAIEAILVAIDQLLKRRHGSHESSVD